MSNDIQKQIYVEDRGWHMDQEFAPVWFCLSVFSFFSIKRMLTFQYIFLRMDRRDL